MKNFIEELQKLPPDDLPELEGTKLSENCMERIKMRTHRNISESQGSAGHAAKLKIIRRAFSVIAAAAMITVMATAVFAYREEIYSGLAETGRNIREFFTREEEIIDPKAEMIHETAEESGVTLTVEKAVRDGEQEYLCVTVKNHDGLFDGEILTCEGYTLRKKADYPGAVMPKNGYSIMTDRKLGMMGVYAGDIFKLMREEPTDTVELMIPVTINGEGSYRFTVDRLMTVSEEMNGEEYTGKLLSEVVAEELTVDFTINSELASLDRTVLACDRNFEVMGAVLTLDSITVSPLEIVVDIRDEIGQKIEIDGWMTDADDCLTHYYKLYNIIKDDPDTDDEKAKEIYKNVRPKEEYDVKIAFTEEELAVVESQSYLSHGYASDPGLVRQTFKTLMPVYPDEIARIWLENINDPEDVIVIWEKN